MPLLERLQESGWLNNASGTPTSNHTVPKQSSGEPATYCKGGDERPAAKLL
jgi:hypothetical protein